MDISPINTNSKNDFLNKAHEARQARELARRQDQAATIIQAVYRSFVARKRLKLATCEEVSQLLCQENFTDLKNALRIIQRMLTFCSPKKDKILYDQLINLIQRRMALPMESLDTNRSSSNDPKDGSNQIAHAGRLGNEQMMDINDPQATIGIELHRAPMCSFRDGDLDDQNLFVSLAKECMNEESSSKHILSILGQLLLISLDYAEKECTGDNEAHPSTNLEIYLSFVNFLTIDQLAYQHTKTDQLRSPLRMITQELSAKSFRHRHETFLKISDRVFIKIERSISKRKSLLLDSYTRFAISCLQTTNLNRQLLTSMEQGELLAKLFAIPAFVSSLETHARSTLDYLKESSTLALSLQHLGENSKILAQLSSTQALCILANLIHLASVNEEILAPNLVDYVVLLTKLLNSCQRNMKQLSSKGQKEKSQGSKCTGEYYSLILGWLACESVPSIDKETSKMIKRQLSYLWSLKVIKILFHDLFSANDREINSKKENASRNSTQFAPKRTNQLFPRGSIDQSAPENSSSNHSAPLFVLRKVMERAATTVTKSFNSSYVKTSGSLSSSSGSAKLITEEATRISLVCYMYHTALRTLQVIRQDILTGLCIHDSILVNLWTFISSLGPQNGMKAFLDHLTVHMKTSAPEFHILTLFCDCASHLISILDDSELYEQQKPFSLENLIKISTFLNMFIYRTITNHLIQYNPQNMDPILQTTHKLLTDLYKRDCRRKFTPIDHWLIKDIRMSMFLKDLEAGKIVAKSILTLLPHAIPHKERVLIFKKLVSKDKSQYYTGFSTFITIHRSRIVEDGYQQLARLPPNALKGTIRVKFINDLGLDEAGLDQDGVFKEFLEDTIKKIFDPALNLFKSTSEQRLYPSPTSSLHEDHLALFNFVGKMLGKTVYEGIVVDVPFASFFLSRVLSQPQNPLYSPIDELPSLDPELYKNLTYIKHYEGDVADLGLTFSIDQDFMGKIQTYDLGFGGKHTPVTRENRVRYIHEVANFHMKTQIEDQTEAFVRGFKSIVNIEWLSMFSASEFQRLISGDTAPIDLQDLRQHTKYFGGFHNNHRVVCWLWDILEKDFTPEEHALFLKFVTSCSKPPLLGFANLEPPFTIRCVEVSDDQDLGDTVGSVLRGFFAIRRSDPVDRLPTSSTCFNVLKLPNYQRRSTLREKLRYAILSNTGFELS